LEEFKGNYELLIDRLKVVDNKLLLITPGIQELRNLQKKTLSKIQERFEDNEAEPSHISLIH